MNQTKSYEIKEQLVYEAYLSVKANKGSCGVDAQSLSEFEQNLQNNLYKLWNRMSSGSYFPQPVKRINIPKADGKIRPLSIPTVTDRIAQMVVKMEIEPELEQYFHPESFGYRPNKSAHQAVELVKERCWQLAWVLDIDIKEFFDTIDHKLLLKAVDKHVMENWQRLYIRRWLQAPIQHPDGHIEHLNQGIPQGGVISPLLANLFLHYTFDVWMVRYYSQIPFVRYADDIICHCKTQLEAEQLQSVLIERFEQCQLQINQQKTKIVHCQSWKHNSQHEKISFDFLGFTFRPRLIKNRSGKLMVCFLPAISQKASKQIRNAINSWPWSAWIHMEISDIIKFVLNRLNGWMNYYGKFGLSLTKYILFHFDQKLNRRCST